LTHEPTTPEVGKALQDLKDRHGITAERVAAYPALLNLPAVQAALHEQGRHPVDLPHVAIEVLRCECEQGGTYTAKQRMIIAKALNFDGEPNYLTDRREFVATQFELYGSDLAHLEKVAFERYASALVVLERSTCGQKEGADLWRELVAHTQRYFDLVGSRHIQEALLAFEYSRSPEEAKEHAREVLNQLPRARKRALSQAPRDLGDVWLLHNVLKPVIQHVYPTWVRLERALHDDRQIYLSYRSLFVWNAPNPGAHPEQERHINAMRVEQELAESKDEVSKFIYWNRSDPPFPVFYAAGDTPSDKAQAEATFNDALKQSVWLIASILLKIEAANDWANVIKRGGPGKWTDTSDLAPRSPTDRERR
jgi:hypothetical protein